MINAFLRGTALAAAIAGLASCQAVTDRLDGRSQACAASGGVLTAAGCENPATMGLAGPAPPPAMTCTAKEGSATAQDGSPAAKPTDTCVAN